jgi:peptidoglycan L-alanyl-D-glutamate endopeptidase CwlK
MALPGAPAVPLRAGRTRPGQIVTFAQAWESYHQYGLAIDIVGHVGGNWTWDLPEQSWNRMHAIGAQNGLERLGFETPHLQLAGLRIGRLMDGSWPDGGDASWSSGMAGTIARWDGDPAAPPWLADEPARPQLATAGLRDRLDWDSTPRPDVSDWHAMFGGKEWRHNDRGVYLRAAPSTPVRTPGAPTTCQAILDLYEADIARTFFPFALYCLT